jgi:IS5 family transposase
MSLTDEQKRRNRAKSTVRAKLEHPFLVMKRIFGFATVRYRGLLNNTYRVQVTCALVNLYMVRQRLLLA